MIPDLLDILPEFLLQRVGNPEKHKQEEQNTDADLTPEGRRRLGRPDQEADEISHLLVVFRR